MLLGAEPIAVGAEWEPAEIKGGKQGLPWMSHPNLVARRKTGRIVDMVNPPQMTRTCRGVCVAAGTKVAPESASLGSGRLDESTFPIS